MNKDLTREQLTETAIKLQIKANMTHRKIVDRNAKNINLHRSQHRMLMHLSKCEKIPSQKEIADFFDISPAAVAVTLKTLEKHGYIEKTKKASALDNRQNEIKITELGMQEIKRTGSIFKEIDLVMFENFSSEELENLIFLLNKINNNLKTLD